MNSKIIEQKHEVNTSAYIVLSVGDLKTMLKAAKADAKKYGHVGKKEHVHCIVLDEITVCSVNRKVQISSTDLVTRAMTIKRDALQAIKEREPLNPVLHTQNLRKH